MIAHPKLAPRLVEVWPGTFVDPHEVVCITRHEYGGVEIRFRHTSDYVAFEFMDDDDRTQAAAREIAAKINLALSGQTPK